MNHHPAQVHPVASVQNLRISVSAFKSNKFYLGQPMQVSKRNLPTRKIVYKKFSSFQILLSEKDKQKFSARDLVDFE